MKIIDVVKNRRTLSFEVFPPKVHDDAHLSSILATITALAEAKPDFLSVTYSPAGRNHDRALEIAQFIQTKGMVPLSHFTAVAYERQNVDDMLHSLAERGIENILALRGDVPVGFKYPRPPWKDFRYASDLIRYVRSVDSGICIGAACYPEGHPEENRSMDLNMARLKEKQDLGADFFITQLAFENEAVFRFLDGARAAGVSAPILVGVMPVLKADSVARMVELSGCAIPEELRSLIQKYGGSDHDMEAAGMEFAVRQVEALRSHGVDGIHIYTMNKAPQSIQIVTGAAVAAAAPFAAASRSATLQVGLGNSDSGRSSHGL